MHETIATSKEIGLVHHTINMDTVTRGTFEEFLCQMAEPIYFEYDNAGHM